MHSDRSGFTPIFDVLLEAGLIYTLFLTIFAACILNQNNM